MIWPFPARDTDPWFEKFNSMVAAQDASGYASREDRHITFAQGGTFSFDATTNILDWTGTLELLSPIAGFRNDVPANSPAGVAILEGEALYVNVVRSPTQNISLTTFVASTIPNTDDAMIICIRRNNACYFRNGARIVDGESKGIFAGSVPGEVNLNVLNISNRSSHDSIVPLVVGAIAFDPTDHNRTGAIREIRFRAMAANGEVGLTNSVRLINVTDGQTVATLSFTDTDTVKDEAVLVEGNGLGEIDASEHVYEVQIFLNTAPLDVTHTVELYSCELRVKNTSV
jgi:hypothetical protein